MWKIIPNTNKKYEWDTGSQKVRLTKSKKELIPGYTHEGETYVISVDGNLVGIKKSDIKEPEMVELLKEEADVEEIKLPPGKAYRRECNRLTYSRRKIGWEVDHIVPVSFCRDIGLTPAQCCVEQNLQYLSPEDNFAKFSFVKYCDVVNLLKYLNYNKKITKSQVISWNKEQEKRWSSFKKILPKSNQ